MSSSPREWQDPESLQEVVESPAGKITIQPLRRDVIRFATDSVINIGRNIADVRANGCAERAAWGWTITELHIERIGPQRLTAEQRERAGRVVLAIVGDWAEANPEKIVQADALDRNNDALRLERQIAEHVATLHALRRELKRCNQGLPFDRHPEEAATDRRR